MTLTDEAPLAPAHADLHLTARDALATEHQRRLHAALGTSPKRRRRKAVRADDCCGGHFIGNTA